jgi:uncharacterized membrane protein
VSLDVEDFLCPVLTLGVFGGLAALTVVLIRRSSSADELHRLDVRIRELSARVAILERGEKARVEESREAPRAPAPPPPAATPTVPIAPPHATASAWTPAAGATRDEPPPLPPPVPVAAPRAVPERPAARADASFESFVGGRVMLVVGVIVVLFGLGFFLKYAIDHEWIGPAARIGMGVLAGLGLLVGGDRMRARGYGAFGAGLMGCGLGALYLTNFFACRRYDFIEPTTAIALTAGITAAGAALALWRDAPLLAYLGFLGGWLAPAVLGDRSGSLPSLTGWLLVLDAGAFALLLRRAWQGFDAMSLAFTGIYFAIWLGDHRAGFARPLDTTSVCLAALAAAQLALSLGPSIVRRAAVPGSSLFVAGSTGAFAALAAHEILFPEHRLTLGLGVGGLGGAYLLAWHLVSRIGATARASSEALLGYALASLAITIAVVTSGAVVAPALAIAGTAIVFGGTRTRRVVLLGGGVVMIVLAFGDLFVHRLGMFRAGPDPILNERFVAFATPCVAMLAAGWMLSRVKELLAPDLATLVGATGLCALPIVLVADLAFGIGRADAFHREMQLIVPVAVLAAYGLVASRWFGVGNPLGRTLAMAPLAFALVCGLPMWFGGHVEPFTPFASPMFAAGLVLVAACAFAARDDETAWRTAFRVLGLLYLLGLLTAELWAWGLHRPLAGLTRDEAKFAAMVWISIAWAVYAATLVAAGFLRSDEKLRWIGLGVFALTLTKVFMVDMAALEAVYRIGSFLVLGALLVGASFLYQRARKVTPPPDAPDPR